MRELPEEELQSATRFVFLSMAIVVMEQDMKHIEAGGFKIKEPYLGLLAEMNDHAENERRQLRTRLKKQNFRIIPIDKDDASSSFLFCCGTKEAKRNYFNPAIRKRVEAIIQEMLTKALPAYQHSSAVNTGSGYRASNGIAPSAAPDST